MKLKLAAIALVAFATGAMFFCSDDDQFIFGAFPLFMLSLAICIKLIVKPKTT